MPLKPPKMLGQSNSISAAPTKRVPLGANRVEVENRNAKTTLGEKNPLEYRSISKTIKSPFDWLLTEICLNALQGNVW